MRLIDMVNNKQVKFVKYQKGELWYVTESGFEFPVPISDTGDGEFQSEDKALFFMRWIKKHMEHIHSAKQSEQ